MKRLIFFLLLSSFTLNGQTSIEDIKTQLVKNEQFALTSTNQKSFDIVSSTGYINLKDSRYLLNYVPIRNLELSVRVNKLYYKNKIDSLSTYISTVSDKTLKKQAKLQLKTFKTLKKTSEKYEEIGINQEIYQTFYGMGSNSGIKLIKKTQNDELTVNIDDYVVPTYALKNHKDTLAIIRFKGYNEQYLYAGFLFSDLNPEKIKAKKKSINRAKRKRHLTSLYNNNPLYGESKDWTIEVFKDTAVFLHKMEFSRIQLDGNDVTSKQTKALYKFSSSEKTPNSKEFEEEISNFNLGTTESHKFIKSHSIKLPLIHLWDLSSDFRYPWFEDTIGIPVDTLYRINYPRNYVKTIFEEEFNKRRYTQIKYETFKKNLMDSITIDTTVIYASSYYGDYPSRIEFKIKGYGKRYNRYSKQTVKTGIGSNGYSVYLDEKEYDIRLGETKYDFSGELEDDSWNLWYSDTENIESFLEEWFNHLHNGSKEYYKEKLAQQEAEKAALKKLYSKYGEKYVKAAEEFDIIVGMHEDLLAYSLKLWSIDRRSLTRRGYTLYCTSMLDSSVRMTVTVTDKKVSYTSF